MGFGIELDLEEVVVSSSGDLGYTLGIGEITMEGPDGEPVVETIRDFHVWRKDAAGEWKLAVDIWNSPEPPPEG
jgi:ketosteroid isomerase-like protein